MTEENNQVRVIVFPYQGQGHMNSMLQFAKRLAWRNVNVTIATTLSTITKKMKSNVGSNTWYNNSIALVSIYDDSNDSHGHYMNNMVRFEADAASNLTKLLEKKKVESNNKCLLVYDGNLPWALDIAHEKGLRGAAFFPQSCATVMTYYCLYLETQGKDLSVEVPPLPVVLPPLELIQKSMPNIGGMKFKGAVVPKNGKEYKPFFLFVLRQCYNLNKADLVLFNQWDEMTKAGEVLQWMSRVFLDVKPIGPTIPSSLIDKRLKDDVDYGFHAFNLDSDACIRWLNTKPTRSVVYIAFGSSTFYSVEQMAEITEALKHQPYSFLWAVRETEQKKLDTNFINETTEKGLVVSWCTQLDVLAHDSVGCFMTHCGMNSIIEALSFGVPMVSMPGNLDQPVDAHFVENVWGTGITVKKNEDGLFTRDEIVRCLEEIKGGERAKVIKANAARWSVSAKEAIAEGGNSDKHIDEIVEWVAS